MRNYNRHDAFLNQRIRDIYPEPLGEPHLSITARMVPALIDHHHIQPGAKVLDVGCGHALALKAFRTAGTLRLSEHPSEQHRLLHNDGRSPGSQQPHSRIAFKQIQQNPQCLAPVAL